MVRYYILFLGLFNIVFTQTPLDIKRLSNSQLDALKKELSQSETNQDDLDFKQPAKLNEVIVKSESEINKPEDIEDYFGYDYFYNEINFFDNIPTPSDFKLGPGDEIIISLWGQTNSRETFIINKEGLIYYKNLGFINISNKTLKEAELLLRNELSKIYSSLNNQDDGTQIMLELGQLKSINVFLTGNINKPGIHLVHPFSDVFTSLVQAGGVDTNGSLRNVEIKRDNKTIAIVDFYTFFLSGINSFSNTRILDGDIIHVPPVSNRIKIEGEIINSGFYELLDTESLSTLLEYGGGVKPTASNKAILESIAPISGRESDDVAKTSLTINLSNSHQAVLSNGSTVRILPIADNDTQVIVYGRVTLPGEYPVFKNIDSVDSKQTLKKSSLKDVLDQAGGFDDPIFRKTIDESIVVLRLDESNFFAKEFTISYANSQDFTLEINDQIFVYENPNYSRGFTYTINGEVNRPGTYPLKPGISLSEAINTAGGITELGSINSLSVTKSFTRFDENGNEIVETELVGNIDLNFTITDKNIISVKPKTNVIRVLGNVYNPGLVAHSGKRSMSMSNAIELAGGYKPNSLKRNSYVIRANGEIEKANIFRGNAKRIFPGDAIFVPLDPEPDEFNITNFIADLSTTLANIAAILVIADNNN
tara:strand:+ start:1609 stop:3558 length:1950 start_codon:yes stop_codon:yes gene_type:complete